MATGKKSLMTVSGEWAKHLRKFWKRKFWKAERRATRVSIKNQRIIKDQSYE
jgi:hypothetical protein